MNMKSNNKNTHKMGLTLGILGFLAGVGLLLSGNRFMGIFGSLASAGLIFKGYKDMKEAKHQENDLE